MAYTTEIVEFFQEDFILNKPELSTSNESSTNGLKFSTKKLKLDLNNTDYKYVKFRITLSGETVDYCSVSFIEPNGLPMSVGLNLNEYFTFTMDEIRLELFVKGNVNGTVISPPQIFYVIVNGEYFIETITPKYENILIYINVGKETPPTSTNVIVEFDCDSSNLIYEYDSGLHVYSPYDSIFSPKLNTKIYSPIPIGNWSVNNTIIYNSPFLVFPALPYYYGVGDYVYKVGGEIDRSYGELTKYEIKNRLFNKPKKKEIKTILNSYDQTTETSLACIKPIYSEIGLLKKIIDKSTLTQPEKYRYYLGYDAESKRNSNDSTFVKFSIFRTQNDPITGAQHAMEKLGEGVLKDIKFDYTEFDWAGFISGLPFFGSPLVLSLASIIIKPALVASCGACAGFTGSSPALIVTTALSNPIFLAIAVVLLLGFIVFKITQYLRVNIIEEDCTLFYHHFTTTPYIEIGSSLFKNLSLTVKNNGYYCDGVYFYKQVNNITEKSISYTDAIIQEDPLTYRYTESVLADNPTFIRNFLKMMLLPYTSGKPLPFCGEGVEIFYNTGQTRTLYGSCCELVHCLPYVLTVDAGTEWSCVSQNDADQKAIDKLNRMEDMYLANYDFGIPFSENEIEELVVYFTHELKVETNPTILSVIFDKRSTSTPTVGKTLYYDSYGCTKVLDGYYSVSGTTYYRTFYKTIDGEITNIYYMENSNSIQTTTGQSIITTNLDYRSNWFLNGISSTELNFHVISVLNKETYDTTTINYSNLTKGLLKTNTDPYPYESFININGSEVSSGWYKPLIIWLQEENFYYQKALTISLKIEEECSFITGYTNTRGFYVVGYNSGYITPTMYPVTLDVLVTYDDNSTVTKNVTTNTDNGKTFVELPENYLNISSFSISNISPTSKNKITYIDNTTHDVCYNCDMNFTTQLNGFILTCTVLNSSPNYFVEITDQYGYYYSNTYTTNQFDITLPSNGGNYFGVTITDNIGCKVTKFVHVVVLTPTPTRTPTPTPTPNCFIYFDVDKTYPTSGQSDGSVDIITNGSDSSYSFWLYRIFPNFYIVVYGFIGEGITLTLGGLSSQVYLYKVIGTSGCEQEVIINMVIPPTPTPTPTPTSTPTCVLFPFIKYAYQVSPSIVYLQIKHFNPNCLFIKLQASTDGISWSFTNIYENICDNGWINDTLTNYSYFRVAARCPDTGIYSDYSEPFYFESE